LSDSGSTYGDNAALQGGAIACVNCQLEVTSGTFTNHMGYDGGLIYLNAPRANVILDSVTVTSATAKNNGGLVHVTGLATSPAFTLQVKNTNGARVLWTTLVA
jgi:hypothetical protein